MESPLRLLPLECTQAHSHHEQNKIQTVTVNLTQCDCLYPCPFHITSLFHAYPPPPGGGGWSVSHRETEAETGDQGAWPTLFVEAREMENVIRCPAFGDFVTIRTEASMKHYKSAMFS